MGLGSSKTVDRVARGALRWHAVLIQGYEYEKFLCALHPISDSDCVLNPRFGTETVNASELLSAAASAVRLFVLPRAPQREC
jgi:hypothetical protein